MSLLSEARSKIPNDEVTSSEPLIVTAALQWRDHYAKLHCTITYAHKLIFMSSHLNLPEQTT